jgi:hypothetical protein
MILAVAVMALSFNWAVGFLKRPYPVLDLLVAVGQKDGVYQCELGHRWSDGSLRVVDNRGLIKGHRRFGSFLRVKWSDGSTSWYLARPKGRKD